VHSTQMQSEFDVNVKGQGHRGQKRKSAAFCSGAVLGGASTPVGKSAHAIYLVSSIAFCAFYFVFYNLQLLFILVL